MLGKLQDPELRRRGVPMQLLESFNDACRRSMRVGRRRKFGALELDPPVVRLLGRRQVDTDGVVALGAQHRH